MSEMPDASDSGCIYYLWQLITCPPKENGAGVREAKLDHSSLFPRMLAGFIVCLITFFFFCQLDKILTHMEE